MPLDPFCPDLTKSILLAYLYVGTLFVVVIFKTFKASAVVNLHALISGVGHGDKGESR